MRKLDETETITVNGQTFRVGDQIAFAVKPKLNMNAFNNESRGTIDIDGGTLKVEKIMRIDYMDGWAEMEPTVMFTTFGLDQIDALDCVKTDQTWSLQ